MINIVSKILSGLGTFLVGVFFGGERQKRKRAEDDAKLYRDAAGRFANRPHTRADAIDRLFKAAKDRNRNP